MSQPAAPGRRPLVFLIGYRGTGKSTVARLLAARLGWSALDADELLETRHGKIIREIFAEEGEAGFRDKETALLEEACKLRKHVIASGGGVVLRPTNRELLRSAGIIVWLTADADTIWQRMQADASTASRRPALTVGGRAEIDELLRQREPLYRECAHFSVNSAKWTPEAIADEVLEQLTRADVLEKS
jgi:shikimate kinase